MKIYKAIRIKPELHEEIVKFCRAEGYSIGGFAEKCIRIHMKALKEITGYERSR